MAAATAATGPLGIKLLASAAPRMTIALYMDPFCPFCSREWQRLSKEVLPWLKAERAGAVDFTMYLLPQPWHPQSGMLCEGALAVQEQSEKAAVDFLDAVWDPTTRSQWGDDVTYTMSRSDVYDAMGEKIVSGLAGIDKAVWRKRLEPLADGGVGVTKTLKKYIKHARMTGVHVSPTCITNGLQDDSVSSSWTLDQWKTYINENGASEAGPRAAVGAPSTE
ncbi:hypothetical protein FNF27_07847 [Cafeteria roenbergensis]|uniref:Thioredoxin-like fold domain-containing protein n=1 Tax=Cafeteria roenbergensis TaxID=33653 RepID=A0A5A8DGE2_CAFRO|nr:hypothetical protein FNF29_05489 [Cafeteria roenbergensis]KAA0164129.1 hypothetical protein FNF27_07847 [Cafeteria roenbergensis]|eukprot:KAA0150048.1 hypothetical protein FNF29_05489 [Cafeteria roenbergensis]